MPIPEQPRQPRQSNNTSKLHEPTGPAILQLNVEGLTRPKCEVIQKIATENAISVILLQETHATSNEKIKIYGYSLIDSINHPKHGIATLVRNDLPASVIGRSKEGSETEWITIMINGEIRLRTFTNHQRLLSNLHLDTNTQLYIRETSIVTIHPGATPETVLTVKLFMNGQAPLTLSFYTILTNQKRFTLQPGTLSPTQI